MKPVWPPTLRTFIVPEGKSLFDRFSKITFYCIGPKYSSKVSILVFSSNLRALMLKA